MERKTKQEVEKQITMSIYKAGQIKTTLSELVSLLYIAGITEIPFRWAGGMLYCVLSSQVETIYVLYCFAASVVVCETRKDINLKNSSIINVWTTKPML